jgi:predicted nucleic acid-binding protein
MIIVIDASVAAKWFFQEEHSMVALNLLDNHFEINVPDFWAEDIGLAGDAVSS